MLSPGRLNSRVTIQRDDKVEVGTGFEANWVDVATVWAEVLPANGGEAFSQGILRQTQFYRVTIRMRNDVTPEHRLIWRTRGAEAVLNIRTCADPDGRREALLMTAESGVAT
jgi:SPP1 family predicted phage head-tail adaptor